jgi:hypothetical protein
VKIPPELKKILDERAGKEHSEDGKVVAALEEILEEYRDMARRDPNRVLWGDFLSNVSLVTPGVFTVSEVTEDEPYLVPLTDWEQPEVYIGFRRTIKPELSGMGVKAFTEWLREELYQIDPDLLTGRILLAPVIDATVRGIVEL